MRTVAFSPLPPPPPGPTPPKKLSFWGGLVQLRLQPLPPPHLSSLSTCQHGAAVRRKLARKSPYLLIHMHSSVSTTVESPRSWFDSTASIGESMLDSRPTPLILFQDNENKFLVDGKTIDDLHNYCLGERRGIR